MAAWAGQGRQIPLFVISKRGAGRGKGWHVLARRGGVSDLCPHIVTSTCNAPIPIIHHFPNSARSGTETIMYVHIYTRVPLHTALSLSPAMPHASHVPIHVPLFSCHPTFRSGRLTVLQGYATPHAAFGSVSASTQLNKSTGAPSRAPLVCFYEAAYFLLLLLLLSVSDVVVVVAVVPV
jgi:hypothetical protein